MFIVAGKRWALPREGEALPYKNWACEGTAAMRAQGGPLSRAPPF
jgi:hypothetical protein